MVVVPVNTRMYLYFMVLRHPLPEPEHVVTPFFYLSSALRRALRAHRQGSEPSGQAAAASLDQSSPVCQHAIATDIGSSSTKGIARASEVQIEKVREHDRGLIQSILEACQIFGA